MTPSKDAPHADGAGISTTRKTDPTSIPAVPAVAADATFFARLRLIDDATYLKALAASAVRGQAAEVMEGLKALRPQMYEPLLWEVLRSGISLPAHPMRPDNHMGKRVDDREVAARCHSVWDAVAIALNREPLPWTSVLLERTIDTSVKARTGDLPAASRALFDMAATICRAQVYRAGVPEPGHKGLGTGYGSSPDGMSAQYGPLPFAAFAQALSRQRAPVELLEELLAGIPDAALAADPCAFDATVQVLADHGDVAQAAALLHRHTESHLGRADSNADLKLINSVVEWATTVDDEEQGVASCLDLLEALGKVRAAYPERLHIAAAYHLLSLAGPDDPEPRGLELLAALTTRIDEITKCIPGQPWPADRAFRVVSRYADPLLDLALKWQQADLVQRLSDYWKTQHNQSSLLTVFVNAQKFFPDDLQDGRFLRILKVAQEVGIDINGRLAGVLEQRKVPKPLLLLHAVGLSDSPAMFEMMAQAVGAGVDPTQKDGRGRLPRSYLHEDHHEQWDNIVRAWQARQKARGTLDEINALRP